MKSILTVLIILIVFSCKNQEEISNKIYSKNEITTKQADSTTVFNHLTHIVKTKKSRNYKNLDVLNSTALYIKNHFQKYADTTYYQNYLVNGNEYKNVIAVFGSQHKKTIVIGAHYDVYGEQEGADDNASGVVGILELARLLNGEELKYRIEIVAYTLEEPPFFRTEYMGSYIHAKSLAKNNVDVYGMLVLEMIGYFDDAKKSQDYPIAGMSTIYGSKADYIALVSKFGKGGFAKSFIKQFLKEKQIKTKKITAPRAVPGIDFSDHLNYWNFGYSALMITDTAFFRNHNYHKETDTLETLNVNKMVKVINSVYQSILKMK